LRAGGTGGDNPKPSDGKARAQLPQEDIKPVEVPAKLDSISCPEDKPFVKDRLTIEEEAAELAKDAFEIGKIPVNIQLVLG